MHLLTDHEKQTIRDRIRTALGLSVREGTELRLKLEMSARYQYERKYTRDHERAFLSQYEYVLERLYPTTTQHPYVWRMAIGEHELFGDTVDECLDQAIHLAMVGGTHTGRISSGFPAQLPLRPTHYREDGTAGRNWFGIPESSLCPEIVPAY